MRRVLILGLLAAAASVAVPTGAIAQDVSVDAEVTREQRREMREQRRQERQARQQQPQQPAVPADAAPRRDREQREDRQERREERRADRRSDLIPEGAWVGNPNDPRMEEHRRRYERLDRENARRNGSPQQLEALIERQRAQREDRREDRRENRQEWREDRRGDRRDDRREWRDDRRENRQEWREDRRDDRRENRQEWREERREDRQDWREDRRELRQDRREWNRDWRRDRRFDWRSYRNYNRQLFRGRPYYAPYRGYNYNRFSIGVILDRLFWGRNYWISDPYNYRLPPAPGGHVWVRYYSDVLLVDTWSGRVVDVIHDFFW